MKTLRNHDEAQTLMRERTPFHSRVRLVDRYGDTHDSLALTGTRPCRVASDWMSKIGPEGVCVSASGKQGETAWGGAFEGTIEGFCHTRGNLPNEYYEALLAADFVVRSYKTPIAWHLNVPPDWNARSDVEAWLNDESPGVWIVPDVTYSPTTHQHQWTVRSALEGSWRNKLQPLPTEYLHIEGALTRVPSGGR